MDDAHARDVTDRRRIDRKRLGAHDGRADDAGVQHALGPDVGDVALAAEHVVMDVGARDGLADDPVIRRALRLGQSAGDQVVADLAVPVQRRLEEAVADQLLVGDAPGRIAGEADDAVGRDQLGGGRAKLQRRALHQHPAGLGGGEPQGDATLFDPRAAGRAALVHRGGGVALDHPYDGRGDVELLGDDLADGDIQALSGVHLAEEGDEAAIGLQGYEAVELVGRQRPPHGGKRRRRPREADQQRAAGLQQAAAGQGDPSDLVHAAPVTRATARMIDICVPQRHFRPVSSSLISWMVARGLSRTKTAAVIIQPLMQ